jgi:hypothetical protein
MPPLSGGYQTSQAARYGISGWTDGHDKPEISTGHLHQFKKPTTESVFLCRLESQSALQSAMKYQFRALKAV